MDTGANPSEFNLRVLTPMGEVLNTEAIAIRVTAWDGQLGVMARHAPMVARLRTGSAVVTEAGGNTRWLAAVQGIIRVTEDEVVMLVNAAEEAEDIDVERAQRALQRAQHRLSSREDETDISRAKLALARAATRLEVAGRVGGTVRD
ncbi:MAG: ATP synthase F1 subunit epsilon [Armatimonadota bacterium]